MDKKENTLWAIELTPEFKKTIKKHNKEKDFLQAFSKKITKLQEDPFSLGKELHGDLHGLSSTRILGKFRLVFKVDASNKRIVLFDVDHRKDVYE